MFLQPSPRLVPLLYLFPQPRINHGRAKERRLQFFPGFSEPLVSSRGSPGPWLPCGRWPLSGSAARGTALPGDPARLPGRGSSKPTQLLLALVPCPLAHPGHGGGSSTLRGFCAFGVGTCCLSRPLHAAMPAAPGPESCRSSSCWKDYSPYWAVGYLWSWGPTSLCCLYISKEGLTPKWIVSDWIRTSLSSSLTYRKSQKQP